MAVAPFWNLISSLVGMSALCRLLFSWRTMYVWISDSFTSDSIKARIGEGKGCQWLVDNGDRNFLLFETVWMDCG